MHESVVRANTANLKVKASFKRFRQQRVSRTWRWDVGEGVTEFRLSVIEGLEQKCLAAESQEKANKQIVPLYQYINTNSHSLH